MKSVSPTLYSATSSQLPSISDVTYSSPSSSPRESRILAPLAIAILLKSALLTLLRPIQLFSTKYFWHKSFKAYVIKNTFAPASNNF